MSSLNLSRLLKGLRDTTVADVWPNRSIVWIPPNCSLEDALQILKQNRIVAVPVVDPSTFQFFGIVDILDIATYIVDNFPPLDQITSQMLETLQVEEKKFGQQTNVTQVIAFAKSYQSPPTTFRLDSPISQLIEVFSEGIHRYLTENIYLLGEENRGLKTVEALGLVPRSVQFVREDISVLHALKYMLQDKLSSLPVLSVEGKLKANLSISDLKGLGPSDFHNLLLPISQFLANFNPKSLYPLTCHSTDTLEYVILKLSATRVHRLWVTDSNGVLQGIISLTDVMRPFVGLEPMQVETPYFFQ